MSARRSVLFVTYLILVSPYVVHACGFNEGGYKVITLRQDAADSKLMICVQVVEAHQTPGAGCTKLAISAVIKDHPILDGRKDLTVPRYIPIKDPKDLPRLLVFAAVADGQIDCYRSVPQTEAGVDYVKGSMKFDGKDRVKVLRYCADYLEDKDRQIADDAFAEFMQSADQDIGEAAKHLSPKTLRGWLDDKNTPAKRQRLYGFLLGNCGGDEDADALRSLLDRRTKEEQPADLDGILSGYTLLKPAEGWAYVRTLVKNPSAPFSTSYACLRAARFFHNTRPDVVTEKDILAVIGMGIDHADMADIPIEYLRKWRCWELTNQVLAASGRKSHDLPTIKRSILRYAFECPDVKAAEFIAAQRESDASMVAEVEQSLEQEAESKPDK
jgi:hypothetical protein